MEKMKKGFVAIVLGVSVLSFSATAFASSAQTCYGFGCGCVGEHIGESVSGPSDGKVSAQPEPPKDTLRAPNMQK